MQEVADGLFAIGAVFAGVDDVLVPELVHFMRGRCGSIGFYQWNGVGLGVAFCQECRLSIRCGPVGFLRVLPVLRR